MTARKTGGGAFDPSVRPLYFAAGGGVKNADRRPQFLLSAVNDLLSDEAERGWQAKTLDAGRVVLLDSGVFALANQHRRTYGGSLADALSLPPESLEGFDALYRRYVELCLRYGDRLWGYIELDQGGAENKRRTRGRLEAEGLSPIPVYHPLNDGWDYFDELACGYDRICVGNVVHADARDRVRVLHTLWERHRSYPRLWIHILGFTVSEFCLAAPPDSCDSSTWLYPLRWNSVRTESAMLAKTRQLGRGFAYDLDNPDAPGRTQADSFGMCSDAVMATNMTWKHAESRVASLSGQPPYPARLAGERPPSTPGRASE